MDAADLAQLLTPEGMALLDRTPSVSDGGEIVRVVSRRGAVTAPVRFDDGLRPGLAFMTLHFPDQVATNELTVDAVDPQSGTSEFKAAAVRIEPLGRPAAVLL